MFEYRLGISVLLTFLSLMSVTPRILAEAKEGHKSVIIATREAPPFVIKTAEGWQGITIELVERIARRLNMSYEFKEMGLEEMLDKTAAGRVDAAAAALTITAERERQLDFTHPFFTSGLGVVVPRNSGLTWLSTLQRIASGAFLHAAGALLGVLTLVGVLVWLVERNRNAQFPKEPVKGVGSGIWWSAVTMTTVGYGDKAPLTLPGRILGLIWMFASIIIISGFTAAIATSLTVGQLSQTIEGIEDLYGKRVLTAKGSTSAAFLDSKLIRYETVPSITDALEQLAAGKVDAVVYDQPILRYLVKDNYVHDLRVLPNQFARQDYGIAIPPGARLRERLNREILQIIQGGEWSPMLEGYLGPDE
jgi:ABC-type amino acid transport substrate-binding protein